MPCKGTSAKIIRHDAGSSSACRGCIAHAGVRTRVSSHPCIDASRRRCKTSAFRTRSSVPHRSAYVQRGCAGPVVRCVRAGRCSSRRARCACRVLTVLKTVFRFRPNRPAADASESSQPSMRRAGEPAIRRQSSDAGIVPSANRQLEPASDPPCRASGFFHVRRIPCKGARVMRGYRQDPSDAPCASAVDRGSDTRDGVSLGRCNS